MSLLKVSKHEKIQKINEDVQSLNPKQKDLVVKYQKLPNGVYESTIKLKSKNRKQFFVKKKDENLYKALDKAHFAILRQIKKHKKKTRISNRIHRYVLNNELVEY